MTDDDPAEESLHQYRHPRWNFQLPLPAGWETAEDSAAGVPVVAVEPDHGDESFRANIVVTMDDLPEGLDVELWQDGTEELLPKSLRELVVLDRYTNATDEFPVVRRLAHHTTQKQAAVTMMQAATVRGLIGYTVTASVASLSLPSVAALFEHVLANFEPGTPRPEREGSH